MTLTGNGQTLDRVGVLILQPTGLDVDKNRSDVILNGCGERTRSDDQIERTFTTLNRISSVTE